MRNRPQYRINTLDLNPNQGVGVALPFNPTNIFTVNYTTTAQIKSNTNFTDRKIRWTNWSSISWPIPFLRRLPVTRFIALLKLSFLKKRNCNPAAVTVADVMQWRWRRTCCFKRNSGPDRLQSFLLLWFQLIQPVQGLDWSGIICLQFQRFFIILPGFCRIPR